MIKDYKNIPFVLFVGFSLIFLASFQIAFINRFSWGFNIFLILILFLILTKNIYSAIFFAWLGGFLTDTAHFGVFGATSLILLILTFFLIIFQKKALITTKTEGILIISAFAVISYHFLEWIVNNIFIMRQEKFGFYFFNTAIVAELFFSIVLLWIIFSYKIRQNA